MDLRASSWSPYLVGALIGLLSWFSFATVDKPLGITTAFESTAALAQRAAVPEAARQNPLFSETSPKIDWEWMLVLGVLGGAWLSVRLAREPERTPQPPALWRQRFGDSVGRRYAGAFVGGGLMMFGARVAQGCTSGHGISGTLQLAVSSWVFIGLAFGCAIATAWLAYGRQGADHVR